MLDNPGPGSHPLPSSRRADERPSAALVSIKALHLLPWYCLILYQQSSVAGFWLFK